MTPEQTVQRASRLQQLLDDPIIAEVLSKLERRFYEEFKASTSSEERVRAWAKASVLAAWDVELKSVLDAGQVEVLTAAKAAKASRAI